MEIPHEKSHLLTNKKIIAFLLSSLYHFLPLRFSPFPSLFSFSSLCFCLCLSFSVSSSFCLLPVCLNEFCSLFSAFPVKPSPPMVSGSFGYSVSHRVDSFSRRYKLVLKKLYLCISMAAGQSDRFMLSIFKMHSFSGDNLVLFCVCPWMFVGFLCERL